MATTDKVNIIDAQLIEREARTSDGPMLLETAILQLLYSSAISLKRIADGLETERLRQRELRRQEEHHRDRKAEGY